MSFTEELLILLRLVDKNVIGKDIYMDHGLALLAISIYAGLLEITQ